MKVHIIKMVVLTSLLIAGFSQSAFAATWIHASQCVGNASILEDGARSSLKSEYSSLVCWADVSGGYGSALDVDVVYTQTLKNDGDEGIECKAASYRSAGSQVHSTKWKSDTSSSPRSNETLSVKDSSANGNNDAVLVRVECSLPPTHTDPRSGSPKYGAVVYRIKVY